MLKAAELANSAVLGYKFRESTAPNCFQQLFWVNRFKCKATNTKFVRITCDWSEDSTTTPLWRADEHVRSVPFWRHGLRPPPENGWTVNCVSSLTKASTLADDHQIQLLGLVSFQDRIVKNNFSLVYQFGRIMLHLPFWLCCTSYYFGFNCWR